MTSLPPLPPSPPAPPPFPEGGSDARVTTGAAPRQKNASSPVAMARNVLCVLRALCASLAKMALARMTLAKMTHGLLAALQGVRAGAARLRLHLPAFSRAGIEGLRKPYRAGLAACGTLAMVGLAVLLWTGPGTTSVPSSLHPSLADLESDIDPLVVARSQTAPAADRVAEPISRTLHVGAGDTLMAMLTNADISRAEAHAAIEAMRDVFNPRSLRPGTELTLTFQPLTDEDEAPATFQRLHFAPALTRMVAVERESGNGFRARIEETPLTTTRDAASGAIASSLYVDAVRAGVPVPTLVSMIRIFSYEVDFQRDIHPGDGFEILFERKETPDGETAGVGDILFAALTLRGTRLPVYRFKDDDGVVDFYNDKGESVRRLLMRTPIDGARLSSNFGPRRHPILGFNRMHRGVDFAAPTGTPIMAAGNGVVTVAGWNGGYGNYIRIRHNDTYATAYAHLSRFARGITRGARVTQGQVIGYVGTTGQSTGPHLHYEVLRNNTQINPMGMNLPTGKALKGQELARFQAERGKTDRLYASLDSSSGDTTRIARGEGATTAAPN